MPRSKPPTHPRTLRKLLARKLALPLSKREKEAQLAMDFAQMFAEQEKAKGTSGNTV